MAKDYYEILGTSRKDSQDDISKAFKKLARKYHPDLHPGDKKAEEKFKELSEAYDVLSNPEKRKKYDAYGSAAFDGASSGPSQHSYSTHFGADDLGDIFGDLFSGVNMGQASRARRSSGFGRGARSQPFAQKGSDLTFSIDLEFMEAVNGCEKNIRLPNGVNFKVKIPAGVHEGGKIRLSGKGEPGINGGAAGDLLIEPKIRPHSYFRRNGFDIELDLPIRISEAIDGAKVRVPTITGSVDLKIPAEAQSGQKLRLKGKGILNSKTKVAGDQYVTLQVAIPKSLSSENKNQLLSLLEKVEGDPRNNFVTF